MVEGQVDANGTSASGGYWGAGGGAGGSIYLKAGESNLGEGQVTALGGGHYCYYGCGGNGGTGRIRIDYDTLSGESSPEALQVKNGQMELAVTHTLYTDDIRTALTGSVLAGQVNLPVLDGRGFQIGDEVLIISMQGSNVGRYETEHIAAIAPGVLTLASGLAYAYDGVTDKVMVQRIP